MNHIIYYYKLMRNPCDGVLFLWGYIGLHALPSPLTGASALIICVYLRAVRFREIRITSDAQLHRPGERPTGTQAVVSPTIFSATIFELER